MTDAGKAGFGRGRSNESCKDTISRRSLLAATLLSGVSWFVPQCWAGEGNGSFGSVPVTCEGRYPEHLQGVCSDKEANLFWSFTTTLVKTDRSGKVLAQAKVPAHHGAPCYARGQLYVPVNLTVFNDPVIKADSWVYVYEPASLELVSKHRIAEVVFGAGGMAQHRGTFLVVGGLPEGYQENYLYQYDSHLRLTREVRLKSGYTRKGIQTAAFADGHWWFGCYASEGESEVLLKCDEQLAAVSRYSFDCSLGIVDVRGGFLVARDNVPCSSLIGCSGTLLPAVPDNRLGMSLVSTVPR